MPRVKSAPRNVAYNHNQCLSTFIDRVHKHSHPNTSGLAIYASNFMAQHRHTLTCNFPATNALLGDAIFSGLTHAYVNWQQDTPANLNLYGSLFPFFLAEQQNSTKEGQWLRYSDMAQIEYAILQLYYTHEPQCDISLSTFPTADNHHIVDLLCEHHRYLALAKNSNLCAEMYLIREGLTLNLIPVSSE